MVVNERVELVLAEKPRGQSVGPWVYAVLKHNIIALHLKPGQAVTEPGIAELLETSRTPVRESFIKLAEDGVLELSSQKGWRVTLIDIDQAEEARYARRVFDKAILHEACRFFPQESLFDLAGNLQMQKLCRTEGNYERMFDLDNDFHRLIYSGCRKQRIWAHQKKMDYNLDRLRALRLSSEFSWDPIIDEHSEIAALIRGRQETRIDALVDRHLTRSLFDRLAEEHKEYFVASAPGADESAARRVRDGATAGSAAQPAGAVR